MRAKAKHLKLVKSIEMRTVTKGRKPNTQYRTREHLTEEEVAKLLAALKRRHAAAVKSTSESQNLPALFECCPRGVIP